MDQYNSLGGVQVSEDCHINDFMTNLLQYINTHIHIFRVGVPTEVVLLHDKINDFLNNTNVNNTPYILSGVLLTFVLDQIALFVG